MVLDKSNMLNVLENFPKQCREALAISKGEKISKKITNIVVAGMGGSAIGGDLLKAYLSNTNIPVFVNRSYKLPNFVNENTLVFAVSYSGNTEETLSSYHDALTKKAHVIAVASGGRLAELCKKTILIPSGLQPRNAIAYLFFPMLGLLFNSGLVSVTNKELNEMLLSLKEVSEFKERAEQIAKKIQGKTPIIYSSGFLEPVAYRWKCEFNENSKQPAFCHVFPEMSHNEIVGYRFINRSQYAVILIRDKLDHPRIQKRMDIFLNLIGKHIDVEEVHTKGEGVLSRMLSAIYLGDFTSYYLAMLNRVDPTPVEVIENLKKALDK